jgi:serine/threonine protein kinase
MVVIVMSMIVVIVMSMIVVIVMSIMVVIIIVIINLLLNSADPTSPAYDHVKLSDFGFSRVSDYHAMRTTCGTHSTWYLRSQRGRQREYGPKVDLWFIGCGLVCDAASSLDISPSRYAIYLVILMYISDLFPDIVSPDIDVYICYISWYVIVRRSVPRGIKNDAISSNPGVGMDPPSVCVCVCVFITAVPITKSCSRVGGGEVEDMFYERRRAEACVD